MISRVIRLILDRAALFVAVGVSILLAVGIFGIYAVQDAFANDFGVYWRTATNPVEQAYSAEFAYPFPYAPTMLLWIKPLALIPFWAAFILWVCVSALALTWACRKYLTSRQNMLVLICPPVVYGLLTGQVSALLAAALLWSLGTSRRLAAGLVLGAIASVKPQLVIMVPLLLLLRLDWRAISGAAMGLISLVLLSLFIYGNQPWFDWVASLENFRAVLNEKRVIRAAATPAALAERWGYPPIPFLLMGAILGAWLVHRCRNLGPVETSAAVAVGSIWAAPYALTYDLAAVAPFLAVMIFRGRLASAFAITGALHPLPLLLGSFELLRKTNEREADSGRDYGQGVSDARVGVR